jgi:hypothetical protein
MIHNDKTPKVFLKFTKNNEMEWIQENNETIKYGSIPYLALLASSSSGGTKPQN